MKIARPCPVCYTSTEEASLFLTEKIDTDKISSFSFSSRKEPEYMRHKLVRCSLCDLVYAPHPLTEGELASRYHAADYDSSEEADDAAEAYMRVMYPILTKLGSTTNALEIGSGTGVFLEHLKRYGFANVVGVEPSSAAIAAAPPHRLNWLREGIFVEKDFEPASFDLICCFMTVEHVEDPTQVALAAHRLLRPGGAFVTVTHDHTSLINRLLGSRSPIIDIEHMQIFSKTSIIELLERCEYECVSTMGFVNCYSLGYWLRLMPLPKLMKDCLKYILALIRIEKYKLGLNVGNIMSVGFRSKN